MTVDMLCAAFRHDKLCGLPEKMKLQTIKYQLVSVLLKHLCSYNKTNQTQKTIYIYTQKSMHGHLQQILLSTKTIKIYWSFIYTHPQKLLQIKSELRYIFITIGLATWVMETIVVSKVGNILYICFCLSLKTTWHSTILCTLK